MDNDEAMLWYWCVNRRHDWNWLMYDSCLWICHRDSVLFLFDCGVVVVVGYMYLQIDIFSRNMGIYVVNCFVHIEVRFYGIYDYEYRKRERHATPVWIYRGTERSNEPARTTTGT